jgi:hypothetical protein
MRITLSATAFASFSCGSSGVLTVNFACMGFPKNEGFSFAPKKLSSPTFLKKMFPAALG